VVHNDHLRRPRRSDDHRLSPPLIYGDIAIVQKISLYPNYKLQDMAKIKTTPALKKSPKRVSTGGKKTTPKPPTPKKHGEKRKLHINEVVTKLNRAVKDTHIPGVDNVVPKLLGVCNIVVKFYLNPTDWYLCGHCTLCCG